MTPKPQKIEGGKKILTILEDVFDIPGASYKKHWESLSIEEKLGALAEKLDEVINHINTK